MRMITAQDILRVVEPVIYGRRKLGLVILTVITLFFAWQTLQVKLDPGYLKMLPQDHPHIQKFREHMDTFGGGNAVLIAVMHRDGDIYDAEYLAALKQIHDEIFFLEGIARHRVRSLYSANTRYMEVTEAGFKSGRVIPANYKPNDAMIQSIREHVRDANIIGRLVANDESGAMISAEVLEINPSTGKEPDFLSIAAGLQDIRERYESDDISIHIIGLTVVFGEFAKAFEEVILFFLITLVLTTLLLWIYCASLKLAWLPLSCSVVAVIWEFGLLSTFGFGLDPFAILVPFLVLSVGVSHGVQFVNAWVQEVADNGLNSYDASLETFRRLAIPGTAALITDVIGFGTIYLINIDIIREMAINAAFGVAAIIITNKWLMPILLSYVSIKDIDNLKVRYAKREAIGDKLWRRIAKITRRGPAITAISVAVAILAWSLWKGQDLQIGDQHAGVPELRPESRYNQDSASIANSFAIGEDMLIVFIETRDEACLDYEIMSAIDRFTWQMQNVPEVLSIITLETIAKQINAFWHDGDLRWQSLSRNYHVMAQSVGPLDTIGAATNLKNNGCSIMPVVIFTEDHRAETIEMLVQAVNDIAAETRLDDPTAKALITVQRASNRWLYLEEQINRRKAPEGDAERYARKQLLKHERSLQADEMARILQQLREYQRPTIADSPWPEDERIKQTLMDEVLAIVKDFNPQEANLERTAALNQQLSDSLEALDHNTAHNLEFALGSGNVGIMGATNEVVAAQEKPILIYVYLAIILMCWLSFRSLAGVLCVVLPLSLVSLMAYGVMAVLGIGLKVATLPVVALAVGIGVDYGIYIYSTLYEKLREGFSLEEAYFQTLRLTGKAVIFTGIALGVGVGTWFFSTLQFQVDMGKILMFIFVANMFGAILLLPALARVLIKKRDKSADASQ